jgi:outer membrane lipoprotein carrier protein
MSMSFDTARRRLLRAVPGAALSALAGFAPLGSRAQDDQAAGRLRAFVDGVGSGRARFEQTVTAADGASRKASSGRFEFLRPGRFRFDYERPYPQLVVSDGARVWLHDPDLQQASVRRVDDALGASPAALLAGGSLERDFVLAPDPPRAGRDEQLAWVRATPRAADSGFAWIAIGLRGALPERIEILDRFGQRTMLRFADFEADAPVEPDRFVFTPPAGTDVVEQ